MIANMHIRSDYRQWIEWPKQRVRTLCGKTTTTRYAGIPSITPGQHPEVLSHADYGWCLKCCHELLAANPDLSKFNGNYSLFTLYFNATQMCKHQIAKALAINGYVDQPT
jgi:hypothetical protein